MHNKSPITTLHPATSRVSDMAGGLTGSEILKIAADIRAMVASGKSICNLTVGDFNPSEFRIPRFLEESLKEALSSGETNYPPSDGMLQLRKAVQTFYEQRLKLHFPLDSILISGGSRPGIYTTYATLVDPGDVVVYPVPSWNNNHYCHLSSAVARPIVCTPETHFLPTAAMLKDVLRGARLLALNSPLNPTGTAFTKEVLGEICDLVLEENAQRRPDERPLYLMYDQVYWLLTFGETHHHDPVSVRPEMLPYTIYVDGISKPFAATGVRVGWTVAPPDITRRMAGILGHVGAWAPRAEQVATARLLAATGEVDAYHARFKEGLKSRLDALYSGIMDLKVNGFPVEAIAPMGAIYLSARFALNGSTSARGTRLLTNEDIRHYLLERAGLAIVPFQAFGCTEEHGWFRLSVGAVSLKEIEEMFPRLRCALSELTH